VTDPIAIEAVAEVRQIKSMSDFSLNVTLNFPEPMREQAKKFIDWQGKMIRIVAVVEDEPSLLQNNEETINAVSERSIRKSEWSTTQRTGIDKAT